MVYSCGNYRSASTGIRHALIKICEETPNLSLNNDYPHQHVSDIRLGDDDIIVYSYRDVRNVITSFIRKSYDEVPGNNFGSYGELSILEKSPIEFLHMYIDTDNYIKNLAKDNPKNYVIINYEDDVMCEMGLMETLSKKLGVPYDDSVISDDLLTTIDNFKNNPDWAHHLNDGKSDFKEVLTLLEIRELESDTTIRNWLVDNNYELHNYE